MKNNEEFEKNYEMDPSFHPEVIDERGNSYIMFAKYKWFGKGDFKLGLRTFYSTPEGERIGKGITFLTDEGPNELTRALLEKGYGHAESIAKTLRGSRPEIIGAVIDELNDMTEEEKHACEDAYVNCDDYLDNDSDMFDPEDLLKDE